MTVPAKHQRAARRPLLIAAVVFTTLVLVVVATITALWISVGGTFRGEDISAGGVVQIGLAVAACVALAFLIRFLLRAAKNV